MSELAGSLLLRHGIVKPDQISAAHALRQRDGGSFGEALVRIGAIDEEQLVEFYHKRLMIPRIDDSRLLQVSPRVLSLVPADMAAEFRVLPVDIDAEGTITLAMSDPTNNHAVDEVAFFADRFVVRAAGTESAVRRAIESHYGVRFTSPRASDRTAWTAPPVGSARVVEPKPQPMPIATKQTLAMGSGARMPAAAEPEKKKKKPVEPPKPSREQLEEQIVLLTKVKRSEETPLPIPVPPPEDYKPQYAEEEPILLTTPKATQPRERRDTVPDLLTVLPDPPLAGLRTASDRDTVAKVVLDYLGALTRRSIFFVAKKQLLIAHDARGELDSSLVQQLAINIDAPSIFRDVIVSRLPYRGPMPETAANRTFAGAVGGVGQEILLMPIAVRERIVAVVFADQPIVALPDAELHATIREAGLAYERILLAAKGR
jgi:hypothetical protein